MQQVKTKFPAIYRPLFEPHRYKIMYGGRGSAKSWSIAQALIILGARQPMRILCARELQKSIRDSVHQLLSDTIARLGLSEFYEIQQADIKGRNGTRIGFAGLHRNPTEIKSWEGADIVWVEEGQAVTEESWDILIPTIRKPGSEIWVSFNPDLEADPTYQRFVVSPPGNSWVCKISWRDNPYFPAVLLAELEECRAKDYNKYLHVWEGDCKRIITGCWFGAAIERHKAAVQGLRGTLREIKGSIEFGEDADGIMELWRYPHHLVDIDDEPWIDRYCTGSDIGEGLSQDYSVAYVYDRVLKEFVARLRSNKVDAVTWGSMLIELSRYYQTAIEHPDGKVSNRGSLIVPERTGAGITTCKQLSDKRANVYNHIIPAKDGNPTTSIVGWVETRQTKFDLLGDHREYMETTQGTVYCGVLLAECGVYIHDRETGKLGAAPGYHDDCVIAAALAIQGNYYLDKPRQIQPPLAGWKKKRADDGVSAWSA